MRNHPNPSGGRPAIFVASLPDYNNGVIHGAWLWADAPERSLEAAIGVILESAPTPDAEEWIVLDTCDSEAIIGSQK